MRVFFTSMIVVCFFVACGKDNKGGKENKGNPTTPGDQTRGNNKLLDGNQGSENPLQLRSESFSNESDCAQHVWSVTTGAYYPIPTSELKNPRFVTNAELKERDIFELGSNSSFSDHHAGQQKTVGIVAEKFEEKCGIAKDFFNPLSISTWESDVELIPDLKRGDHFSFSSSFRLRSDKVPTLLQAFVKSDKETETVTLHDMSIQLSPWIVVGNRGASRSESLLDDKAVSIGTLHCETPYVAQISWQEEEDPSTQMHCPRKSADGKAVCLALDVTQIADRCSLDMPKILLPDNKDRYLEAGLKGFIDKQTIEGDVNYLLTINVVKIGELIIP